jgi:hypothetical protein
VPLGGYYGALGHHEPWRDRDTRYHVADWVWGEGLQREGGFLFRDGDHGKLLAAMRSATKIKAEALHDGPFWNQVLETCTVGLFANALLGFRVWVCCIAFAV